jgi:hypothetical protein
VELHGFAPFDPERDAQPLPSDMRLALGENELGQLADYEASRGGSPWVMHYSVPRMIGIWRVAVGRLNEGDACVDDYSGAVLLWRDRLESVLEETASPLRERLVDHIGAIDETFRAATTDDVDGLLARFYKVHIQHGWWWRRIPLSGSVRRELDG